MIQEPTDPLWAPVKAITGWVETNEDVLGRLPAAFEQAAVGFETAAGLDTGGLRASWPDGAGTEYLNGLAAVFKSSTDVATTLRQGAALATNMVNQVVGAKQAIVATIAANSAAYASMSTLDDSVRELSRSAFVDQVASIVLDILTRSEQAVRGLAGMVNAPAPPGPPPAPPPPPPPEEKPGETAKLIGDIAGMVNAVAGAASLIPGVALVAAPIALASGVVALGAHSVAAIQSGEGVADVVGDAVGLVPGVGAAVGGFRATDAVLGVNARLAGGLLALEQDAGAASGAARLVGDQIAPHLPASLHATGDGVARVMQGGAGLATQVPTAQGWITGEDSGEVGTWTTNTGTAMNVINMLPVGP